jgi:hypothetical protein
MAVAVQFGGNLPVGGSAHPGGTQDDAAAEGQRLRGGAGADESFESAATIFIKFDTRGEGARHGCPPGEQGLVVTLRSMMTIDPASD